MADVALVHFLKGYLEGRVRQRQEEEEQQKLEQQQSVVLAQFLEGVKQREQEEKYRAFQMEMSKKQMELTEQHQAFMERHYTIMQDIQQAELQLRQEEQADRRQLLGLQIQGNLLNMLGETVQMFGDPKRAIEFLQKNPNPIISDWAKGLNPNDTRLIAKTRFYPQLQAIVSSWKDVNPPSDKIVAQMLKINGLENVFSPDEVKSLYAVQAKNNRAEFDIRVGLMKEQSKLEMQQMAFRASLEAKTAALKQAQTEAQKEALRKEMLFNIVGDVTPVHAMLTGDVVDNLEEMKKAYNNINGDVRKAMLDIGVDPQVATFYTLSALYTLGATKKDASTGVMHLLNTYMTNEAMRRSWYKGASVLASMQLGRPATEREVNQFIINYGTRITGSQDVAKSMLWNMTGNNGGAVIKSAK